MWYSTPVCQTASISAERAERDRGERHESARGKKEFRACRHGSSSASLPNRTNANMAKVVIADVAQLKPLIGTEVAVTDWFTVSQERIDAFAGATEDDQWIHVDRKRAARESPYGTTVAHGFLTLSLLPHLMRQAVEIQGMRLGINYGLNRVRFTGPVPAGSRVRARFRLAAVEDIVKGVQTTWNVTVEREGEAKPVLVAEWITRRHEEKAAGR